MELPDGPMVTRVHILHIQVCVPDDYTDAQIEAFANSAEPCGTTGGWMIDTRPEVTPGPCAERKGYKHVILNC